MISSPPYRRAVSVERSTLRTLTEGGEHVVAHLMAHRVVDDLEPVKVDDHDGVSDVGPVEDSQQLAPTGKPREGVRGRRVEEALDPNFVRRLLPGDAVADQTPDAQRYEHLDADLVREPSLADQPEGQQYRKREQGEALGLGTGHIEDGHGEEAHVSGADALCEKGNTGHGHQPEGGEEKERLDRQPPPVQLREPASHKDGTDRGGQRHQAIGL